MNSLLIPLVLTSAPINEQYEIITELYKTEPWTAVRVLDECEKLGAAGFELTDIVDGFDEAYFLRRCRNSRY